mgnify:CR=1 FL=1
MDTDEMTSRVMAAQVGQEITLADISHIQYVRFTFTQDNPQGWYCWIGRAKGFGRSIHPLATAWTVKQFKTLAGAKRNFLNMYNKED